MRWRPTSILPPVEEEVYRPSYVSRLLVVKKFAKRTVQRIARDRQGRHHAPHPAQERPDHAPLRPNLRPVDPQRHHRREPLIALSPSYNVAPTDEAPEQGAELQPTGAVGTRLTAEQFLRLSELIEAINDRFGLNLTEADVLFFEQVGQDMMADDHLETQAKANPKDGFKIVFEEAFLGKVLNRKDRNEEMLKMVLDSPEFAKLIKD